MPGFKVRPGLLGCEIWRPLLYTRSFPRALSPPFSQKNVQAAVLETARSCHLVGKPGISHPKAVSEEIWRLKMTSRKRAADHRRRGESGGEVRAGAGR